MGLDLCIDLGNRQTQSILINGGKAGAVATMPSLFYKPGRLAAHQNVKATAYLDYLGGLHGTKYLDETFVLGAGSGPQAKPVYQKEISPGSGKLMNSLFFTLAQLPNGGEVGTVYTCHPDPTAEIVGRLEKLLIGEHSYMINGKEVTASIDDVVVYPEGYPAFAHLVSEGVVDTDQTVIVLDIGGLTAIGAVFNGQYGMQMRFTERRGGTHELANAIANAIAPKLPGENPSLKLIMDGLADGSYMYGTRFSFKDQAMRLTTEWSQNLMGELMAKFDSVLDTVDLAVVVGGGAHYFSRLLQSIDGWKVPVKPEEANIQGLLTLATMKE